MIALVTTDTQLPSAGFMILWVAVGLVISTVGLLILRPLIRRYCPWVRGPHSFRTNVIMPVILILWGGALWALTVAKGSYDNIAAMIAGTFLSCAGVVFLIKAIRRKV